MDLNYDDLNDLHNMEGTFSRTCWGHYPVSRMTIPRNGEEILSLFNGQMSIVDDPTEEPFWGCLCYISHHSEWCQQVSGTSGSVAPRC
jgi:hypothetical protein